MNLFRYPGGKQKISKLIIPHFIDAEEYSEPFFGGGSIGLELLKHKPKECFFNDADISIYSIWDAVFNNSKFLKAEIMKTIPSVTLFNQFKTDLLQNKASSPLIGAMKIAIHQMSYSGLGVMAGGPIGGISQTGAYKIDCRWNPVRICNKIDEINVLAKKHKIHITCLNFSNVIKDIPTYLDPPYYIKGKELYKTSFDTKDHVELSEILKKSKNWLLSYDNCEEIRNLYTYANINEINIKYSIKGIYNKSELLITPI